MGVFARKGLDGEGIEVWTFKYIGDCGACTFSYPKYEVLEGRGKNSHKT